MGSKKWKKEKIFFISLRVRNFYFSSHASRGSRMRWFPFQIHDFSWRSLGQRLPQSVPFFSEKFWEVGPVPGRRWEPEILDFLRGVCFSVFCGIFVVIWGRTLLRLRSFGFWVGIFRVLSWYLCFRIRTLSCRRFHPGALLDWFSSPGPW